MHSAAEIAVAGPEPMPGQVVMVGWEGGPELGADLTAAIELDRASQERALAAIKQLEDAAHAPAPPLDDGLSADQRASLYINLRRLEARGFRPTIQSGPGKTRPTVTVWFDNRGGLPHLIACGATFRPRGANRERRRKGKGR